MCIDETMKREGNKMKPWLLKFDITHIVSRLPPWNLIPHLGKWVVQKVRLNLDGLIDSRAAVQHLITE